MARIDEQEKFLQSLHDNVAAIGKLVISYICSSSSPTASTSEAGPLMAPNVDIDKASEIEMPVIVDKVNDEHFNPEWSNGMLMHSTSTSDCSTARLSDPVCCADVNQKCHK